MLEGTYLFYLDKRTFSFYDVNIGMVATGRFSAGNAPIATISAGAVFTVHYFGKGESCQLFANPLHAGEEKGVRQEVLGQGLPQEANYSALAYDFSETHLQV
jgi:hypothetical protein